MAWGLFFLDSYFLGIMKCTIWYKLTFFIWLATPTPPYGGIIEGIYFMKTRKTFAVVVFSLLMIMFLMVVSCTNSGKSALVGKWGFDYGHYGFPDYIELFRDGTGIYDGISISWKIVNKRFVITSALIGSAYDYEIMGGRITFIDDKKNKATYLKGGSSNKIETAGMEIFIENEVPDWLEEVLNEK
jgi:hypothetical protein